VYAYEKYQLISCDDARLGPYTSKWDFPLYSSKFCEIILLQVKYHFSPHNENFGCSSLLLLCSPIVVVVDVRHSSPISEEKPFHGI
jgi:hypothetical protein